MLVSDFPPAMIRAFGFLFGALWGSFFNVAIYRWPREMSVVSPPSHCPSCGAAVPWYRNLPILGYVLLRGKAACCGAQLTPRYFLVELLSGALGLALAERFIVDMGPTASLSESAVSAGLFFAFVGGLVVATFVDLEWMEIPDEVSIGGTALGLATVTLREPGPDAVDVALGAGGGFLMVQLLLVWAWERLTGRRGMGEGDSKLLMFIGAFLGWKGALFALVGGAFQGVIVSAIVVGAGGRMKGGEHSQPAAEGDPDPDAPEAEEDDQEDGEEGDDPEGASNDLLVADGTRAVLDSGGSRLIIQDDRGRLLWEYIAASEDDSPLRRPVPFGPFLALGALEFLFFGEPLIDLYLRLFD
ncbi:MAG: prepilin peptidase [Sandaracinaceae bacterium]|nr:prepilin peptidase [Myxococcales bacterium]